MTTFVAIPVVLGSQAGAVATGWAPQTPALSLGLAGLAPLALGLAGLAVIILLARRSSRGRGRTPTDATVPDGGLREAA